MKRKTSTAADARRRVDRLRALRSNPAALREFALEVLAGEASPELVKLALESLGEQVRPADGDVIRDVYHYFDAEGPKRDPSGPVRVEALRALWYLRSRDDLDLAFEASRKVERTLNGDGEVIRAAGLALLGVLDPGHAAYAASLVVANHDANKFSGEPMLTAIRLLASIGETRLLFVLAANPPPGVPSEAVAEAIRSLASVPEEYLAPVLAGVLASEDEAVFVGTVDLVIQLPPSQMALKTVSALLNAAPQPEFYEFLVSSVVASRRQELITIVLETLPHEMSQKRLRAAKTALELAPHTPEVTAAVEELESRIARQQPQTPSRFPFRC